MFFCSSRGQPPTESRIQAARRGGKSYNRLVSHSAAQFASDSRPIFSGARSLSGFFLSGLLFGFLGAILPAWGFHLNSDFVTVGNYFLCMSIGVVISTEVAVGLLPRLGVTLLLVFACAMACAVLVYMALTPFLAPPWRMLGLLLLGLDGGLLNTAVFHSIAPAYEEDPAGTANLGGIFFGTGCLAVALLIAGAFYAYTVSAILLFIAIVPGFFGMWYALGAIPPAHAFEHPSLLHTLREIRTAGTVLFALLLLVQFCNEWSIAGWLPIFLIRRLGIGPEASLLMLAFYWGSLLVGRVAVWVLLPRVRHGRLLLASAAAGLSGCLVLLATNNRFGAVAGILLVGTGFAAIYPLAAGQIGHRFPYYESGFLNGIFSFAMTAGMLAPCVLGYLAHVWGVGVVMGLPLAGTCIVFILVLLIWLEAKVRG